MASLRELAGQCGVQPLLRPTDVRANRVDRIPRGPADFSVGEPEEEVEEFEEEELELEEETQNRSWGTIIALGAAGIAVLVSMLWFFQFQLQTYDLIGLESAAVEQFNAVILEKKRDHLIHFTKDGNVLWAAAPDIIEGEAYLKLQSVAGRALSSEPLEIVSQGKLVQALVPFQRFSFQQLF